MTNCKDCGTSLVPLFQTTWYCPNNCDKKPKVTVSECPKRWWTWVPANRLGKRRTHEFLVLDDALKKSPSGAKTYEIKLVGEYTAKKPTRTQDKHLTVICPGPGGVSMVRMYPAVITATQNPVTKNMKSFNDRATDLAKKVILGQAYPFELKNRLSNAVKYVTLNIAGELCITMNRGFGLAHLPPGVVKLAGNIYKDTVIGLVPIKKKTWQRSGGTP